ncbi:MAG: tripartite tricarboxylate transporter permease [Lautropia sp.]|nr:tripartite tricarboxylate transporter permease [Lautropia sp.]
MIDNLILGFTTALTPENMLWCFVGVAAGTAIGMLPGLGATTGVAILIPLTLTMEPVTALIMLAGIYYGAQYGGTIASVLIATPGDASAVATTLDGYAMARNGRAGVALAVAAIGSFVASIISLVLLMALATPIAHFALNFGPAENLSVMILGMTTIVAFSGDKLGKGLAMAGIGILIASVGVASGFSTARFTFGQVNLLGGIDFVVLMIGLFAIGEVLSQVSQGGQKPIRARFRDMVISRAELAQAFPAMLRGSLIGFLFGVLPGAGSTLASFMGYGVERSISKNRSQFGKGAIEGVAAPESANNAAANANFVPTLALGIPGGSTTAVLLGAFVIYGLQPGPMLFENQPALVWGLLASFFVGNVLLLILNLPLAPAFAQILRVPYSMLYPLILFFSLMGAYAVSNNLFGLNIVFIAGVVGFFLKKYDYPAAPLILGLVLGPLLEKSLVQTSAWTKGDFSLIFQRPIAVSILVLSLSILIAPLIISRVAKRKMREKDMRDT